MTRALLLSGGIESTALAALNKPDVCFTIDYGQRPFAGEKAASEGITKSLGLSLKVIHAPISELGSGQLAGKQPHANAVTAEWWPFRNQYIITIAAMAAIQMGAEEILIGFVSDDNRFLDSTNQFVNFLDSTLAMQEGAIRLTAPAINLTSKELLMASEIAPEILAWTHSCHIRDFACSHCRGCEKNQRLRNWYEKRAKNNQS